MNLDSKKFGLPVSTVLIELADDQITMVIDRKSRIIMADGRKILDKAVQIKILLAGKAYLLNALEIE